MSLGKWEIQPAPTAGDPKRQVLLLHGDMKDVLTIIKKFGALCGRPDRNKGGEEFNFRMYLHRITPAQLAKVSEFLENLTPPPVEYPPGPVPEIAEAAPAPEPALNQEEAPAAEIPAAEALFPAVEKPVELIPLAAAAPPPPSPPPPPPPVSVVPPPQVPASTSPVQPAASPAAPRPEKVLWGLEIALDEKRSMDTLLVGSFNRFAHAAATSTVSAPGTMYNPLLVHGGVGVGKTQMLHAIGNGLSKPLSADKVVMTSGVRFSTAVSLALASGKMSQLEEFFGKKKALLIDDAHLIAVNEVNQPALAAILAMFLGSGRQVVVSSLYPPRALSGLEEALKISFGKGWAVDMKIPNADTQKDMLLASFLRLGLDLSGDEGALFHEKLGAGYSDSSLWIRRLFALKDIHLATSKPTDWDALLKVLFQAPIGNEGDVPAAADVQAAKGFRPPDPDAAAENLAIVYPAGQDDVALWCLGKLYEAHGQFGLPRTFRHVLFQPYDGEHPLGVPFQIGEACRAAGADAALVLGPPPASKLAERVNEFSHAVRHILAGLDISLGWIPYTAMTIPVHSVYAVLDLHARRLSLS